MYESPVDLTHSRRARDRQQQLIQNYMHQLRKQSETKRNRSARRPTISVMNEYSAREIITEQIQWIFPTFYKPKSSGP